jgi:hypothetical protein
MAAITDLSNVVNLATSSAAQRVDFSVDSRIQAAAAVSPVIGQATSLWRYNKTNGANGAIPTSVAAPDRTTLGAMRQVNAASGKQLWLLGMEAMCTNAGGVVLYDRLLHIGGLSGIVTTAQAVGGALTRNVGGDGNQIWIEIYTAIGTTATTITASYTNQAGAAKTTLPVVFGGTNNREESRVIRLPLADGDTGVQGVTSVTVLATTGTAGNFGVVVARQIGRGYIEGPGCAMFRDFITSGSIPLIPDDACLALVWQAAATAAPKLDFAINMVEK